MDERNFNQMSPFGQNSNNIGMNGGKQEEAVVRQYTMPGILHFLQTEWAKFEMERAQWEVERAELQARIAFLQGERKGQENLKNDLVRRIKMLEYALKQERSKFYKLKYGSDMIDADYKSPYETETKDNGVENEVNNQNKSNNNLVWKQSRHLLRQYLQEIGYTDTVIDVRAARVRQLLGLPVDEQDETPVTHAQRVPTKDKRPNEGPDRREPSKKMQSGLSPDNMMMDAESAVMDNFDFLSSEHVVDDEEENMSDGENDENDDDDSDEHMEQRKSDQTVVHADAEEVMAGDAEAEEALAQFDFLVSERGKKASDNWPGMGEHHVIRKPKDKSKGAKAGQRPTRAALQEMLANLSSDGGELVGGKVTVHSDADSPRDTGSPEDPHAEAALGLGELAGLTVNNDAETHVVYDGDTPVDSLRKSWTAKYILRSHFDGVRALAFHPVEPVLVTASEDSTLKLWNLQKTVLAKKAALMDVEPVYTFRAHRGPALCLAVSPTGETCYSGGSDGSIHCWNMPNSNVDPYDLYDPSVLQNTLIGHTDAVWSLAIHSHRMHLLSCSADGGVCLWDPCGKTPLLSTLRVLDETGVPTAVDCVRCEPNHIVVSYNSGKTYLFDIETNKQLMALDTVTPGVDAGIGRSVNHVVSHPTLPVTITAHEDRTIKFTDNNSGKVVHSMMAHLDAVTSLAVDPNGLYLLSGSHDCSVRLWSLDNKSCVQEITAHRKKHDEAIHSVAFHPSKPYIASAGADALAKVYA